MRISDWSSDVCSSDLEDLFYRLHVLPIHLPPLRQRPGDVPVLAQHFLSRFAREEHKSFRGFSDDSYTLLMARDWPGNVRQLKTLVHRLVVMFDEPGRASGREKGGTSG